MAQRASYSDAALANALASATSWRGVLHKLGLRATSGGAIASVRRRAQLLGCPIAHLDRPSSGGASGALAIGPSVDERGPGGGRAATALGGPEELADEDLGPSSARSNTGLLSAPPSMRFLRQTGPLLAASWYSLRGAAVSWPLEPCSYDLLVGSDQSLQRVQVKTTATRENGAWKVFLSRSGRERRPYRADEVDLFFLIDGDFGAYVIPANVIAQRHAVHLNGYERWRVHGAPFVS